MNNLWAFLPMRTANEHLGDADALRQQLNEDGYLYFQQVLDREKIKDLSGDMVQVMARHGWVEPPAIPMSARCLVTPVREDDDRYPAVYDEIQRIERLHALAHDPDLMAIMRTVLGDTAFPHPLKIARLAFPDHYEASTPPHQDFPNNQGTPDLTASWIPAWDMPPEMGGLAVLRGSHRWGCLPLARHLGAGNRCAVVPPDLAESCRWVTTDFKMGDVLLFPAYTVHAALHNGSEFNVRLSVDYRYQLEGQPLTPIVLEPHFGRLTWEDVYRGWRSAEHQYYWRDLEYEVVPFETIPMIDHVAGDAFTDAEMRQIYRYHERVDARTARRLASLTASAEPPGPQ